jgi:hypothetical protein
MQSTLFTENGIQKPQYKTKVKILYLLLSRLIAKEYAKGIANADLNKMAKAHYVAQLF